MIEVIERNISDLIPAEYNPRWISDEAFEQHPKYCQVIIDRMLEFDPTLEVTVNGEQYTQ